MRNRIKSWSTNVVSDFWCAPRKMPNRILESGPFVGASKVSGCFRGLHHILKGGTKNLRPQLGSRVKSWVKNLFSDFWGNPRNMPSFSPKGEKSRFRGPDSRIRGSCSACFEGRPGILKANLVEPTFHSVSQMWSQIFWGTSFSIYGYSTLMFRDFWGNLGTSR